MTEIAIFNPAGAPHDEATIQQLETCAAAGDSPKAALCADGHLGYSAPIGSAISYSEWISPSSVGYDIACGNKAAATSLLYGDIKDDLPRIMDEVFRRISFGMGLANDERVDHEVLDDIAHSEFRPVRKLAQTAAAQLGTVGAGNHYVDLFREANTDRIWVGVHFGSRGFGHKVASGFLALANTGDFDGKHSEGGMMAEPTLIHIDSPTGYLYLENMELAGRYAYAGRDAVVDKVLEILGNPGIFDEVHNHHNFAWREHHDDQNLWVIRKGSTPLFPGQRGFVGATMGEDSVILRGKRSEDGARALWSAPHGAGRAMSRTEAAGKKQKRWTCLTRDCDWFQPPKTHKPDACPQCGNKKLQKRWVQTRAGSIDYAAVKEEMKQNRIEIRGGAADEAPGAYKRLPEVLLPHASHVEVEHVLHPIGVAMAGDDVFDPYRD